MLVEPPPLLSALLLLLLLAVVLLAVAILLAVLPPLEKCSTLSSCIRPKPWAQLGVLPAARGAEADCPPEVESPPPAYTLTNSHIQTQSQTDSRNVW